MTMLTSLVLVGLLLLIITEIRYYRKGWGLHFYIFDPEDRDAWVKPFPTKLERAWLLIAIIAESVLFLMLAIPFMGFLLSSSI